MADDDLVVRAELLDGVSGPARRAEASVDRLAASARRAGQATGGPGASGVLQMATAGDRLSKIAGQTDLSLNRMSQTAANKVGSALKVVALGFGVATAAAVGYGIKTAMMFENQRIQLEGLTGSAEAAKRVSDFITKLDPDSPFDIGQLTQAATQLASAGLEGEKLQKSMQGVADVASSAGGSAEAIQRVGLAIAQMSAAGVVNAQDLNQLVQAQVNVGPALVKASGMSLAEFKRRGPGAGVSSEAFLTALFGEKEGFAKRASESLTGRISSVRSRVMIAVGKDAQPLNEALKGALPAIEGGVGILLDKVFPPLVGIATILLNLLVKGLPVVAPILEVVTQGLQALITNTGPAMAGLGPLSGDIGDGLKDMFQAIGPLMPDIVRFLVGMVGLLPDMLRLMGGLVILADPALKLLNVLLGFGPTRMIFAGLLLIFLGYSKLSGPIKAMRGFAEMLGLIAAKQTAVNVANAGAGVGGVGAGGAGGAGGPAAAGAGGAAAAASGGSKLGLLAKAAGGAVLMYGIAKMAGDWVTDKLDLHERGAGIRAFLGNPDKPEPPPGDTARPWAGSGIPGLLAAAGMGGLTVTSGQRNWGLGGLGSDHSTGRAVDLQGSYLNAYKSSVERMGGFAEFHGDGNTRHLHAVGDTPRPRPSAGALGGEAPIVLQFGDIIVQNGDVDIERAMRSAIAKARQDERERARRGA